MIIKPQRLVVVANIIMDIVIVVDRWPERAGDILAQKGQVTPGGAFNVIAAAYCLGLPAVYGGLIGTGPFGRVIQQRLTDLKVGMAIPPTSAHRQDTGFDVAIVEPNGERTFLTVNGYEARMTTEHLEAMPISVGDVVYLSGYNLVSEPSASALAQWVPTLPQDAMVVLDPGPLIRDIPAGIWGPIMNRLDLLTLNAREASLYSGRSEPEAALPIISSQLSDLSRVLVRAGAMGAWLLDANGVPRNIPSRVARVIDTTGAGDVHTATLLARLAKGIAWEQAVREANICSSLAVEREGPSACPTLVELEAVLAQQGDTQ